MAKHNSKAPTSQKAASCLFLSQKYSHYVLTQNTDHYLLVKIPLEKTDRLPSILLSKKAESIETWRKQGFSARGIPKQNLRLVTAKGQDAIREIELYIGREQLLFTLDQVYTEDVLKEFFPAHLVTRQYTVQEDVDRVRRIQKRSSLGLHLLCFASCLGLWLLGKPYWLWCGLCIALQLVSVFLPLWKPLIFSLEDYPRGRPLPPGDLISIPFFCGCTLGYASVSHFEGNTALFSKSLILTAILAIPFCVLLLRRFGSWSLLSPMRKALQFLARWFITILLGIGTVCHILLLFL